MAKGFFLVIDGPNGVGKSTICTALNERLARQGRKPHLISEPSRSQIGELVKIYRERPEHNLTLACLLAADRYSNIIEDIRPKKAGGYLVISDRYIPSTFVYQILYGLPYEFLKNVNLFIDKPDLIVILDTDFEILLGRLKARQSSSFSENLEALEKEARLYAKVHRIMRRLGYHVIRLHNTPGLIVSTVDKICEEIDRVEMNKPDATSSNE